MAHVNLNYFRYTVNNLRLMSRHRHGHLSKLKSVCHWFAYESQTYNRIISIARTQEQ